MLLLHTAIEMDFLKGARFMALVESRSQMVRTTSSVRETEDEAALRKACANQLVIGLMDLLNEDTKRKDCVVCFASQPWDAWFGDSNKRLRNVSEGLAWSQEQLRGAFLGACTTTFGVLTSPIILQKSEFVIPNMEQVKNMNSNDVRPQEDDLAELFAQCVCVWHQLPAVETMLPALARPQLPLGLDDRGHCGRSAGGRMASRSVCRLLGIRATWRVLHSSADHGRQEYLQTWRGVADLEVLGGVCVRAHTSHV